jgi:hypothetical protein
MRRLREFKWAGVMAHIAVWDWMSSPQEKRKQ